MRVKDFLPQTMVNAPSDSRYVLSFQQIRKSVGRPKGATAFRKVIETALQIPYPCDPDLEPEMYGLTYGEVMIIRQVQQAAAGDGQAFDRVMDRMIGKPTQVNENIERKETYVEFLVRLQKEIDDKKPPIEVEDGRSSQQSVAPEAASELPVLCEVCPEDQDQDW